MKSSTKFALKQTNTNPLITGRAAWNAFISEKPLFDRLKTVQNALIKLREFMLENNFSKAEQKQVAKATRGLEFIIQVGNHSEKPKSIVIVTRMTLGVMHYRVIRAQASSMFPARVDAGNRIESNEAFGSRFCVKATLIASASGQLASGDESVRGLFTQPQFG